MLVSITRQPRLALPMLLGAFLLSLSGHPSPAQAREALAHRGTPGQVRVMIAPAATVIRTLHYQAELTLTCSGVFCSGQFPKPGKRRRLNVTRMSCIVDGTTGSEFNIGRINLLNADHSHVLFQFLSVDYSGPYSNHILNRAVDVQIRGGQHISVSLYLANGTPLFASCTATGTLDVLQ